jgi:hypothetical protein
MTVSTRHGQPIASRQDRKGNKAMQTGKGVKRDDDYLENTEGDIRSHPLYARTKRQVALSVARHAKKQLDGTRSVNFGAVARTLESNQKQFMQECLADLASEGVLRYDDKIMPNKIYPLGGVRRKKKEKTNA